MTWQVLVSDQVRQWLDSLDQPTFAVVMKALEILSEFGPVLGRPYVGKITGSRVSNLKELRPLSNDSGHVRILFAFDSRRAAILLIAGDKTGQWRKWYKKQIPEAERLFQQHLKQNENLQ
jgi:hypothetical protein